MKKYFNTTLGLSMLPDGSISVETLTAEEATGWLREGFENVANPSTLWRFRSESSLSERG